MKFSEEDKKAALSAIKEGKECVSEVAKKYNIPVDFLENILTDVNKHVAVNTTIEKQYDGAISVIKLFDVDIFNKDQENELNDIIMNLGTHFCGISESDVRRVVYEYAETNNINHNFDTRSRQTSEIWYLWFIRSYPGLNYVIRKTKSDSTPQQESISDPSTEISNRNNSVIEKFLQDYGCKQKSSYVPEQEKRILDEPMNDSKSCDVFIDDTEKNSLKNVDDVVSLNHDLEQSVQVHGDMPEQEERISDEPKNDSKPCEAFIDDTEKKSSVDVDAVSLNHDSEKSVKAHGDMPEQEERILDEPKNDSKPCEVFIDDTKKKSSTDDDDAVSLNHDLEKPVLVHGDMPEQEERILDESKNDSKPREVFMDSTEEKSSTEVDDDVSLDRDIIHENDCTLKNEIVAEVDSTTNKPEEKQILPLIGDAVLSNDLKTLSFDKDVNLVPTTNRNDIPYPDKSVCMNSEEVNGIDHRRNIADYFANPDDLNLDENIPDVSAENCEEKPNPLAIEKFETEFSSDAEVSNFLDPSTVKVIMQITKNLTENEDNTISDPQKNADLNRENYSSPTIKTKENEQYLDEEKISLPEMNYTSPASKNATTLEGQLNDSQDNFESSSLESGSYVSCVSPSRDEIIAVNTDTVSKFDNCCTDLETSAEQATIEENAGIDINSFKKIKTQPTDSTTTTSSARDIDAKKNEDFFEVPLLETNKQNCDIVPNLQNDVDSTNVLMLKESKDDHLIVREENGNDDGSDDISKTVSPDNANDGSEITKFTGNICQSADTVSLDSSSKDGDCTHNVEVVTSNDNSVDTASCTNIPGNTISVDHTKESNFSNNTSKSKRKIADSSVEKGNHVSRKKMKIQSKAKNHKTTSRSYRNKPKKSIYLYKLKSYSGSELHFTSPTSVTFIKPVIRLTKLDETKYTNILNEILPPQKEQLLIENESTKISPELVSTKTEETAQIFVKEEPVAEEKVQMPVKEESVIEEKFNSTNENSTPTFSMQTRKKRLKFLPDGTLVTPKQEPNDESVFPSPRTKGSRKRALKSTASSHNSTPNNDKKNKITSDDNDRLKSSPAEAKNTESRLKKADKYIPPPNNQFKKPQKIFDYEGYYREKSKMVDNNQAKKILLPPPPKKQTVALSRVKSISQSAKSGQLVVNPAQLLSCLLGTPITQDQIRTVRFKPSNKQRLSHNQVKITPSKLASDNDAIKPVAKRQLELLQNTPLNIFPKTNVETFVEPTDTASESNSDEIKNL